jgi:hypothetical protein
LTGPAGPKTVLRCSLQTADKCKQADILTSFQTKVNKKTAKKLATEGGGLWPQPKFEALNPKSEANSNSQNKKSETAYGGHEERRSRRRRRREQEDRVNSGGREGAQSILVYAYILMYYSDNSVFGGRPCQKDPPNKRLWRSALPEGPAKQKADKRWVKKQYRVGIIPNFKEKSIRKLATDFTDVFATKAPRHEVFFVRRQKYISICIHTNVVL